MGLLTYWIHEALTLTCFTIDSSLIYKKEDTLFMQSYILKKPSTATFPKSIVRKGELESWGCDGRRGLNLVDDNAISNVAFGVPNIGGNVNEFLFLTQQETWANHFYS